MAGGGTKNYGYIHFSVFLNYGDAVLDVPLLKHLAAGKLFVGQKLRVVCSFLLFFFLPFFEQNISFRIVYCLQFILSCADLGSRIMWLGWACFPPWVVSLCEIYGSISYYAMGNGWDKVGNLGFLSHCCHSVFLISR
jgi:hypothetical protein